MKYSFDNFYVNKNNKQAFFAARNVAEHLGDTENPLYIYGGTQTGKTHILHSIEQYLHQHKQFLSVVRVTTYEFEDDVLNLIRSNRKDVTAKFRRKYRNADVLLIDDIQELANKKAGTMEFINIFNALYETGGQIIITGNASLKEMQEIGLPETLVSRLGWGKVVEIPSDLQYTVK